MQQFICKAKMTFFFNNQSFVRLFTPNLEVILNHFTTEFSENVEFFS